jgi:hypothetical protein
MAKTRQCPNCGAEFYDEKPRVEYKCKHCEFKCPPRKSGTYKIRKALSGNPGRQCVCCGARGSKEVKVGEDHHLLCLLCHDFSHTFTSSREEFTKYRESGGAACWLMAGKRTLLDNAPVGNTSDIRFRDIPRIKDLRRRPGSFLGGAPFGHKVDKLGNLVPDDQARLTISMIGMYLKRRVTLNGVCRELRRLNRPNKGGCIGPPALGGGIDSRIYLGAGEPGLVRCGPVP